MVSSEKQVIINKKIEQCPMDCLVKTTGGHNQSSACEGQKTWVSRVNAEVRK